MNKIFLKPTISRSSINFFRRNFGQTRGNCLGQFLRIRATPTVAGLALNYAPFTDTLGGFDASLLWVNGAIPAPLKAVSTGSIRVNWRNLINPADAELSSRLWDFPFNG